MRDEVEVPATEPWHCRLLSSTWCLTAADAEEMSSAALANDDVEGMFSGGSTRGPLEPLFLWSFLRSLGSKYDDGGTPLEDDAAPLLLLPHTRTVAGKAGGISSSNLNRTLEANSGVLLARDGANMPPLEPPAGTGGEAKDSR